MRRLQVNEEIEKGILCLLGKRWVKKKEKIFALAKKGEEDFVSASSLVVAAEKSSQRAPSPQQLCSCALCTVKCKMRELCNVQCKM